MAGATYQHHVAGPALIAVAIPQCTTSNVSGSTKLSGSTDGSNLLVLGYSVDGATVSIKQYTKDIAGDQNGGPDGPPVDVLAHGESATITFDLVDYVQNVYEKLAVHKAPHLTNGTPDAPGTYGTPELAGTLILAGSRSVRLVIAAPNDPFNFLYSYWLDTEDFKLSTGQEIHRFKFQALVPSYGGVLFNRTIT